MDQVNAHLSQSSSAIQRDWMYSGLHDGAFRPNARRQSHPVNIPACQPRLASESGLDMRSTAQGVSGRMQDGPGQPPPQTLRDTVLPSPAPSDDTPQIISFLSTQRPSQDRQQPQSQQNLDLDGMGAVIVAHHQALNECGKQAAIPSAQTTVANPGKRPTEFEDSSQPKRRAIDVGPLTPAQSASPRAAPMNSPAAGLNWEKLIQLLHNRQLAVRAQGLETYIISNRLRLLREACELKDMTYLAMHQVFCVTSVMKLKNPASRSIAGIGILCQLLLKNETLDKESIEWFSTFPSSFPISPNIYIHEYNQVQISLKLLEQNWCTFQDHFIAQKSPPLDIDFIVKLQITSPILQRIIYRCVCRGFWPPSPEDSCLQGCFDLFTRYQLENRYLRVAQNLSNDERTRTLGSNYRAQRSEYLERWQNHRKHVQASTQRTGTLRCQTSSEVQTQRSPVTIAAPAVVPSNDNVPHIIPGSPAIDLSAAEHQLWMSQIMQINSRHGSDHLSTLRSLSQSALPQSGPAANATAPITFNPPDNASNAPVRRRGRPLLSHMSLPSNDSNLDNSRHGGASNNTAPNQPNRGAQQGLSSPIGTASQSQRHNTLPSTATQPQPRFVFQVTPFQRQQHQQSPYAIPSNTPFYQSRAPSVSLFRSIDYTGTPLHPVTSTLHQAHLEESPITIATEGGSSEGVNSKYLHYLDSFALPPFLIKPHDRNRRCTFTISNPSFNLLAKPSKAYDAIQTQLRPNSQTYRLRCIKVSNPAETYFDKMGSFWSTQDTYWPALIIVKLNDKNLEIRRKEVHGKDHYAEISNFIQEGENKLYISLLRSSSDPTKDSTTYAIAIETLQIKSISTAREELGHLPETLTREAILTRLKSSDPDIEIVSGAMMRLSLIDPISLQLIKIPVRGAGCKHFECFDLESFLSTRHDTASPHCAKPEAFRCPICGGDARPKVLLHDDWQSSILASYTAAEAQIGVKSVVVNEGAEWKFDVDKQDGSGKGGVKVKMEEGEKTVAEGEDRERQVIVLD